MLSNFFQQQFLENPVSHWCWAIGILCMGFLLSDGIAILLSKQLFRLVQNRSLDIPITDFVALEQRPLQSLLVLGIIYLASDQLVLPKSFGWVSIDHFGILMLVSRLYHSLIWLCAGWVTVQFVTFLSMIWQQKVTLTLSVMNEQLVLFVRDLGIVLIWLITVFIVLAKVFQIDVAALVASLGIGGLAIALAAKETVENFLATFTIFLDKLFGVGDIVQLGNVVGEVETMGFRSTRIRMWDGSQITIPNRLIVSQVLEKQTETNYRRHKFTLKIDNKTSPDLIKKVIVDIRQFLKNQPKTDNQFVQIRLENLGEDHAEILVMYYVETTDWNEYIEIKELVNFKILEVLTRYHIGEIGFSSEG